MSAWLGLTAGLWSLQAPPVLSRACTEAGKPVQRAGALHPNPGLRQVVDRGLLWQSFQVSGLLPVSLGGQKGLFFLLSQMRGFWWNHPESPACALLACGAPGNMCQNVIKRSQRGLGEADTAPTDHREQRSAFSRDQKRTWWAGPKQQTGGVVWPKGGLGHPSPDAEKRSLAVLRKPLSEAWQVVCVHVCVCGVCV